MQSIKKNYIYSVLYQILIIFIPLVTTPYLTRVLSISSLGIYSFTNSIAQYFYLFTMLGIMNYGNRSIARVRDDKNMLSKTFNEIYKLQLLIGIFVICLYSIYVIILLINQSIYIGSTLIWLLYICSGVVDISWFYWGIENFKVTILKNVLIKIISTVGIFLFVKNNNDLNIYVFFVAGGAFISQIVLWVSLKDTIFFQKSSIKEIFDHFKPIIILFIPVIAVSIYTILDKLMLGGYGLISELGFYDNFQKIMILPTGILTSLGAVTLPRISNLVTKQNFNEINKLIRISISITMLLAFGMTFGIAGIAKCFVPIYFGPNFSNKALLLAVFTVTIPFIAWANILRSQYLIPFSLDKIYIISVFLGALVNILLNVFLLPTYGALGATIATIFAEFTVALYQTYSIKTKLPISTYLFDVVPYFIFGLIMFIFIYFSNIFSPHLSKVELLFIQLTLGIIVYLTLCLIFIIGRKNVLYHEINQLLKKRE